MCSSSRDHLNCKINKQKKGGNAILIPFGWRIGWPSLDQVHPSILLATNSLDQASFQKTSSKVEDTSRSPHMTVFQNNEVSPAQFRIDEALSQEKLELLLFPQAYSYYKYSVNTDCTG